MQDLKHEIREFLKYQPTELYAPGLCNSFKGIDRVLEIFHPSQEEIEELKKKELSVLYWASLVSVFDTKKRETLTPMRETILCFILEIPEEQLEELILNKPKKGK